VHGDQGLSSTHEMYLKVLYRLQEEHDVGRVRDMAKGLGVTPSTVSAVLKKLEHAGLVVHDRYGLVKLTPAGYRLAECVVHRFETIRALLIEVLGLEEDAAEVDACMLEHAVSPATVNRMEWLLELVRRGQIDLHKARDVDPSSFVCADCAASGTCRAAADFEAHERN